MTEPELYAATGANSDAPSMAPKQAFVASEDGPWSTRIPAAIAKAEKRLRELGEIHGHTMTLTEVALAKALWEDLGDGECVGEGIASHCDQGGCFGLSAEDEPALRAFTEKVEALP